MSKNWGRTPITNADNRRSTLTKYLVETKDGLDERIDRRPLGKSERFVDPAGNVVSLQIYGDGDARKAETEIRMRSQYHRKGLVEFAKCPIKHGTRYAGERTQKDFAKMPAELAGECPSDPKVMERRGGDLYAKQSCPHIEWLIKYRTEQRADAFAKSNAHIAALEKAKRDEDEIKKLQLAKLRAEVAPAVPAEPVRKVKKDPE